jgi:hypothetical protein
MLPIADIIRISWKLYTEKFKQFMPPVAVICGISLAGNIGRFFLQNSMDANPAVWKSVLAGAVSLIISLASFLLTIYLVVLTAQLLDNKKPAVNLKKDVATIFVPAAIMSLLVGIITVTGFILFIVPGVLFTVWYAFVMYMVILEKKSGWGLLAESKKLSAGRFWPVFGRLILPSVFWGLISYFVLAGVMNIIGLILNQSSFEESAANIPLSLVVITLGALITTFFSPLLMIVNVIVYREVRK